MGVKLGSLIAEPLMKRFIEPLKRGSMRMTKLRMARVVTPGVRAFLKRGAVGPVGLMMMGVGMSGSPWGMLGVLLSWPVLI